MFNFDFIGTTVTYIRHNQDGVSQGEAVLKGVGLDPDGRVIVLLKEGENAFNTFASCLNPTEEFCAAFTAHVEEIEALAKEGNEKNKSIVDDYNARIKALRDEVVGEALECQ